MRLATNASLSTPIDTDATADYDATALLLFLSDHNSAAAAAPAPLALSRATHQQQRQQQQRSQEQPPSASPLLLCPPPPYKPTFMGPPPSLSSAPVAGAFSLAHFDIVLLLDLRESYSGPNSDAWRAAQNPARRGGRGGAGASGRGGRGGASAGGAGGGGGSGGGDRSRTAVEALARMLASPSLRVEVSTLALGDVLWVAEHRATGRRWVLDCVLERKMTADLVESIRDGRYHEQRDRLRASGLRRVTYLIEGPIKGEKGPTLPRSSTAHSGGGGGGNAAAGAAGWKPDFGSKAFWANKNKLKKAAAAAAVNGASAGGIGPQSALAAPGADAGLDPLLPSNGAAGLGGSGAAGSGFRLIDTAALETALATLETCFGFAVYNSSGFDDTKAFLATVHAELTAWYGAPEVARRVRLQDPASFSLSPVAKGSTATAATAAAESAAIRGEGELLEAFNARMRKRGQFSHATLFLSQLRQVKGVGPSQAAALARRFRTPARLAAALEACATPRLADAMLVEVCAAAAAAGERAAKKLVPAAAARVREVWMEASYASAPAQGPATQRTVTMEPDIDEDDYVFE